MKTIQLAKLGISLIFLGLLAEAPVYAQHEQMKGPKNEGGFHANIPDLTTDQQKKIDDLALDHQKKMLQFKNQAQEKEAALNTLRTADKADMTAINKTVDEIGAIRIQMMKERENHHQQVRSILTDKQRIIFDTHAGNMMGKGHRNYGMGRGMGDYQEHGNHPKQGD